EIDDQLVAGKLPAIALTRDGVKCPAVHDCDLPKRVGYAVRSAGASRLPRVAAKPMRHLEHAFGENPPLIRGRPGDDHLDDAVFCRGAAHGGCDSLHLGEWT